MSGDDLDLLTSRTVRHRSGQRRENVAVGVAERHGHLAGGAELDAFVGDAAVLTDDFAPVDQLLTPYARTAG